MSRKITLVTCRPTNPVYKNLPFKITSFLEMFQVKPLRADEYHFPTCTKAYSGTCPIADSNLITALKAAMAAIGRETKDAGETSGLNTASVEAEMKLKEMSPIISDQAKEITILKERLPKANTRLKQLSTIISDQSTERSNKLSATNLSPSHQINSDEQASREKHEQRLAPSRLHLLSLQKVRPHICMAPSQCQPRALMYTESRHYHTGSGE